MKHVDPSAALLALARRYRRAEDGGFPDAFLIVVCAAGGLATGGVALLAFVPTHAALVIAYVAVLATTLAVLVTVLAMVNGEERDGMVNGEERDGERTRAVPDDRSPHGLSRGRGWRRRYANARAMVALIVLAAFVVPGIAAVIGAVVAGW
jgi:hypothetical protein